ncbi:MAG: hypothetical protein H6811_02195 [Phycisphaeraceae bacterium]|nr:hypothetical protein [Phycisphaeraceae bacterium]
MNPIRRIARSVTTGALALALSLTCLLATPRAAADDTIYLKDGRVVTGTIKQDLDGYIWIATKIGGVETELIFKPSEIDRVERDAAAEAPTPVDPPKARPANPTPGASPRAANSGAPRAAVLSLGEGTQRDMVGLFITAESIRRIIPLLEEEGVQIVVLRINSGGGALLEIQRLSDLIEYELKPKFRVVAWIESAISAAAMTSHAIEEIYFMTRGNYGACTGWYGQLTAVKGRGLEDVLYMMEQISERGGYDPRIMRAMQILDAPLSATIDENGEVHWYGDADGGEILVNRPDRILCFNASDAARLKFSKGTADNLTELASAMQLPEVEWVGKEVAGVPYPVSKAEKALREFRLQTEDDQNRTNEYFQRYTQSINIAQSQQNRQDRAKFVNQARQALELMKRMVRNNPNFILFVFGMETQEQFDDWVAEQEKLLRDLMR